MMAANLAGETASNLEIWVRLDMDWRGMDLVVLERIQRSVMDSWSWTRAISATIVSMRRHHTCLDLEYLLTVSTFDGGEVVIMYINRES